MGLPADIQGQFFVETSTSYHLDSLLKPEGCEKAKLDKHRETSQKTKVISFTYEY